VWGLSPQPVRYRRKAVGLPGWAALLCMAAPCVVRGDKALRLYTSVRMPRRCPSELHLKTARMGKRQSRRFSTLAALLCEPPGAHDTGPKKTRAVTHITSERATTG
jgi:hypothetical protein